MIGAIILAAGESRRMGFPKALLPVRGNEAGPETTFLEHLLDVLTRSRAEPIVVVLGHESDRIRSSVAPSSWGRARPVLNDRYREGMLTSILAGIAAVEKSPADGVLILPVDHPDVRVELVDSLIERFGESRPPVLLPVHRGRRGHPVLFSRTVFGEIRRAPEGVGARQVVWDHQGDLLEIEVSDPGIGRDVDTPSDYRSFRERSR